MAVMALTDTLIARKCFFNETNVHMFPFTYILDVSEGLLLKGVMWGILEPKWAF